jgi:hypothetical protein
MVICPPPIAGSRIFGAASVTSVSVADLIHSVALRICWSPERSRSWNALHGIWTNAGFGCLNLDVARIRLALDRLIVRNLPFGCFIDAGAGPPRWVLCPHSGHSGVGQSSGDVEPHLLTGRHIGPAPPAARSPAPAAARRVLSDLERSAAVGPLTAVSLPRGRTRLVGVKAGFERELKKTCEFRVEASASLSPAGRRRPVVRPEPGS